MAPLSQSASGRTLLIERVSRQAAALVWRELVHSEWLVLDAVDDGHARRFVLARFVGARPWRRLSPREKSVVAAVAAGHTNRQIAASLGLSISTVAGHLQSARRKLGVTRRVELAREGRASEDATEDAPRRVGPHAQPPDLVVFRIHVENVRLALLSWRTTTTIDLPSLSTAERAMLQGILDGKANAEIAAERRTALRTVANQVARLFKKLGVRSRSELAARHRPLKGETRS